MQLLSRLVMLCAVIYLLIKRSDFCAALGYFFYRRGNLPRALKWYQLGRKIGKMSVKNRISHAYLTLKSGDLDEANKLFTLVSMETLKPKQRYHLNASHALVFWKKGEVDQAIEMLESVVAHMPTTPTYGSLGYMYAYSGRLTDALELNQKALDYNSSDPIIVDNLAYTYLRVGEYEKAEEMYQKLFALNPTFPEGYFEYGKYLVEKGRKNEGIASIQKALDSQFSFLSMMTRQDVHAYLEALYTPEPAIEEAANE